MPRGLSSKYSLWWEHRSSNYVNTVTLGARTQVLSETTAWASTFEKAGDISAAPHCG